MKVEQKSWTTGYDANCRFLVQLVAAVSSRRYVQALVRERMVVNKGIELGTINGSVFALLLRSLVKQVFGLLFELGFGFHVIYIVGGVRRFHLVLDGLLDEFVTDLTRPQAVRIVDRLHGPESKDHKLLGKQSPLTFTNQINVQNHLPKD